MTLVPVSLNKGWQQGLRPNDPVPLAGHVARDKAFSGIQIFCIPLSVPVPPLNVLLPRSLFFEYCVLLS